MSAYNIIIWSLNAWGIKFEMLNHGGMIRATVRDGRVGTIYTGEYEFRVDQGKDVFIIIPDPDSLEVRIDKHIHRMARKKFVIDLHDPESLPKLKEILWKS